MFFFKVYAWWARMFFFFCFLFTIHLASANDTKENDSGGGGLCSADPKGRHLAPWDFVCKANPNSPH